MLCPKCKNVDLKPTKLDDSLPALSCPRCDGSFLSLLYYRDWAERNTDTATQSELSGEVIEQSDTKTALACPKCSRLMIKYLVTGALSNRIDLCASCDEAWLDNGEWSLLKQLELTNKLPQVFTEAWQRKVRYEKSARDKIERLQSVIGETDTLKASEIKKWLSNHKYKSTIIQFLGSD